MDFNEVEIQENDINDSEGQEAVIMDEIKMKEYIIAHH